MGFAIGFVDMFALRASAAGVAGVYQHNPHACPLRLVFDKFPELKERPTVQRGSLRATNCYPVAYSAQVFQSDSASGVFRLGHELLADAVIGVFRKAMFPSRQFFQLALGRPSAFGLQLGPQPAMPKTHMVDMASGVNSPIRVHSDIGDSQIYAKYLLHINQLGIFHVASGRQEKHIAEQAQIRLALPGGQQFPLAFAADKRDTQPTVHRPNRDFRVFQSPRQNTIIIGDAAQGFEAALALGVQFVGVRDFGDHPHRHLGRKGEFSSQVFVAQVMQVILLEGLGLTRLLTDKVAGGIRQRQRAFQGASLFRRRQKFDLGHQLHGQEYSTNELLFQVRKLRRLRLFNISLANLGAHTLALPARASVSGSPDSVTFRPHGCVFAPISPAGTAPIRTRSVLFEPSGCNALEVAHDLSGSELGRGRHEQMHTPALACGASVVRHAFNRHAQCFKPLLGGDFSQQSLQANRDWPAQHLFAVMGNPHQMVVDVIDTVR